MKFINGFLILFCTLFLTACKDIKIENGEVPEKYIADVQKYLGDYSGQFEGREGNIKIYLEGRKLILTYQNSNGDDLLDPRCDSRIGRLKVIGASGNEDNFKIKRADFAFSPGNCATSVEGNELVVWIKERDGRMVLSLEILERFEWERRCRWDPGDPRRGGGREICDMYQRSWYLRGKFDQR